MKYYSETLKQLFDSVKELEEAEVQYQKELEENSLRKAASIKEQKEKQEEIVEALEAFYAAKENYLNKITDYFDKYLIWNYIYPPYEELPNIEDILK